MTTTQRSPSASVSHTFSTVDGTAPSWSGGPSGLTTLKKTLGLAEDEQPRSRYDQQHAQQVAACLYPLVFGRHSSHVIADVSTESRPAYAQRARILVTNDFSSSGPPRSIILASVVGALVSVDA